MRMVLLVIAMLAAPVVAADPHHGVWSGTAECHPTGQRLRLQLAIAEDPGNFIGIFNSPDQNFSTSLRSVDVADDGTVTVVAEMPNNSSVQFEGAITDDVWQGTIEQGPLRCGVSLKRTSSAEMRTLNIPPAYQSAPMWCWLTVGEMVLRHAGVLDADDAPGFQSQCRILRTIMQGSQNFHCSLNCQLCGSLGGGSSREVAGMLSDYPRRLRANGDTVPRVFSSVAEVLPKSVVRAEIDADHPVIVGISPDKAYAAQVSFNKFFPPMHVALIVGYMETDTDTWYLVNDPYPFNLFSNPYKQAGAIPLIQTIGPQPVSTAYWIKEPDLHKLSWSESIMVRVE